MTDKVSDAEFKEKVIDSELPVMVDFWADWCMPCRMIAPIIDDISEEYKGKLDVYKMNIDESASTAAEYGIMSIPTLFFFKDGEVVDKIVGAASKETIVAKIASIL
ncbi:MAG: thioredoxin [Elusimicrobia bacterium]|nr:thioredoxin [Elusimicrobiota bacterium]